MQAVHSQPVVPAESSRHPQHPCHSPFCVVACINHGAILSHSLRLHVDNRSPVLWFTPPAKGCCLSETAELHHASLDLQSDVVITSKLKAALGLAQLHNKKYKMAAKRFTEVGAACPSLLPGGLGLLSPEI